VSRIDVVRRDPHSRHREHSGELVLGERLAALAHLGPRAALDRDQLLDQVRRRDFHVHLLGEHVRDRRLAFLGERVTDVGE
jgi:hypothetical protein